jgi:exonuclease SbcC
MRPIKLTVAGLHSFREKQVVHFNDLCERGVFGIFGPTGSGKSSLLDALTLSLFGKVERANNNTQGIMNHAEDRLSVSFTFELGNAVRKNRYRVERTYIRTGDVTMKSGNCRMIEIGDGEMVLADKERDVTQAVQQLLGLTNDDFTRAVVLPQGKFAEFLSLKGAERRKMLQRLFHLEQYGDRLNQKLKTRYEATNNHLNEIIAEQHGLGDASEDALKNAKEAFSRAEKTAAEKKKHLQEVEERFETNKQLWHWQDEKQKTTKNLSALQDEEKTVESLKTQLNQAQQADALKPFLDETEKVNAEKKTAVQKAAFAKNEAATASKQHETSLKKYEEAKQKRSQEEPKLVLRKEQLKQAKTLQQNLVRKENEAEQTQQELSKVEAEKEQTQTSLDKTIHLHQKALDRQKQLKEELKKITVSYNERENVRKANEAKQAITNLERTLREKLSERQETEKRLSKMKRDHAKYHEACSQHIEKLHGLFLKTTETYNRFCEIERELKQHNEIVSTTILKKEEELERERTHHLALKLTEKLEEGQPCPVCGAVEHPATVSNTNPQQESEIETALKRDKEDLERRNRLIVQIERYTFQLQQLSNTLVDVLPSDRLNRGSVESAAGKAVEEKDNDHSVGILNSYEIESKSLYQDIIGIEENSKKVLNELRSKEKSRDEAATTAAVNEKQLDTLTGKTNKLQEEYEQRKNNWRERFPDYTIDSIEKQQETLDYRDQRVAEFQTGLDTSVTYIEENEKEADRLKTDMQQLKVRFAQLKTSYEQQQNNITEKKNQLHEQIGGDDLDQLLDQVMDRLSSLEKQENNCYETWQTASQSLQEKNNRESAANESLESATSRLDEAEEKRYEQQLNTSFSDVDEVKAAMVEKSTQEKWQSKMDLFYDRKKVLEHDLKRLEKLLDGKTLSVDTWNTTQQERDFAKQGYDEALEQRASAKRDFDYITEKHERFTELEKQRKERQHMVEQLGKLQTVFRGNSFVEFVAEEQLHIVSRDASARLGDLTRQRYAIEVDSGGGFIIRDDANGGIRRPVSTLSGGETFLTSLALALSLSAQIQLRGEYPLQFFFLDEGFGTLDQDLLDTVITALEKLHLEQFSVGVISHVPELRARLPRRLIVEPPEPSGIGSRTRIESM